jgi:hypothetical protein
VGNLELLAELGQWEIGIAFLNRLKHLDVSHCELMTWPTQVRVVLYVYLVSFMRCGTSSAVCMRKRKTYCVISPLLGATSACYLHTVLRQKATLCSALGCGVYQ